MGTHTHIHGWSMCEVGLCIKNEEVTHVFTFVVCKHAYAFGGPWVGRHIILKFYLVTLLICP